MWNEDLLVPNFLDEANLEQKALRDGSGEGLVEIAENNQDLVVLNADLEGSLRLEKFKEKFPHQFIQVGVAEQAMAGIAIGLAYQGKRSVFTSFAAFSPGLNWSQIRLGATSKKPIGFTVLSSHYGLNVGEDGVSAQMLADVAIMRVLPNMQVYSPADYSQTKSLLKFALSQRSPQYFRVTRSKFPVFLKSEVEISDNKAQILKAGKDITVAVTGSLTYEAIKTVEILERDHGVSVELINVHTIKPLDTEALRNSINKTGKLAVIEEHYRAGGLGSAIIEALSEEISFKTLLLGIDDKFGNSASASELYVAYELTREDFATKIRQFIDTK